MLRALAILPLTAVLAGCPVTQPQDTPVAPRHLVEPRSGRPYWLYVPSTYTADRDWPLVITLHGTHGWDGYGPQIREWKALAERRGLLVAAPRLDSVQGILPVVPSWWRDDLQSDERAVLFLLDELSARYRIDRESVLLTGFSAGGYPLYYIGLRNPKRFCALVARACNSSMEVFNSIEITDDVRKLPILIFWGKDDLPALRDQSWQAFRFLRENRCFATEHEKVRGGHLRRPEVAYEFWRRFLPARHRN